MGADVAAVAGGGLGHAVQHLRRHPKQRHEQGVGTRWQRRDRADPHGATVRLQRDALRDARGAAWAPAAGPGRRRPRARAGEIDDGDVAEGQVTHDRRSAIAGFAWVILSLTGVLLPQYQEKVFTYSQPAFFGELAIMLWLVIKGARPPALGSTTSLSAVG